MKVIVREESPNGTVVESSVTFEKEKMECQDDNASSCQPVMPGPIAICGIRALKYFLFGRLCCGGKRNS